MPRPDLALLVPDLAGGGAERCAVNLATELCRRGVTVQLVAGTATGPLAGEVPRDVDLVGLGTDRVRGAVPALARYLRRQRPRALLSSLTHLNVAAVVARAVSRSPTRVVVWEHNTLSQVTSRREAAVERLYPFLVRHVYPAADAIVAVSEGVRSDLVATAGLRASVEVLPNPVVTPRLRAGAEAPAPHPWFGADTPVLVTVGRLAPQKDIPTLLHAAAVARRRTSFRLVLVGDGPERPRIRALVRELGLEDTVDLAGFVTDPYPYLFHARALVLSSRYEGLPTVIIEAMAAGCPVVATDCPSGPRELLDDGRWGRLVPVGDVDALAGGILDAVDGRVAPAPERAWRRFEVAAVADHFLRVLGAGDHPDSIARPG